TISPTPQIRIGAAFDTLQIVTKQVSSIDGKQTLKSPSDGYVVYNGLTITSPNRVNAPSARYTEKFKAGEKIDIRNAIFGVAEDKNISGNTNVNITDGILTIASNINIANPNDYKKIRVVSLLVDGDSGESLNLAGEYPVDTINKSGSVGA